MQSRREKLREEIDSLLVYLRQREAPDSDFVQAIYEWYFGMAIPAIKDRKEELKGRETRIGEEQTATATKKFESEGWEVQEVFTNGHILSRKWSKIQMSAPGDYIFSGSDQNTNSYDLGKRARLRLVHPEISVKKNVAKSSSQDLWIFGKNRLMPDFPNWIRFYFNLKADHSIIYLFIDQVSALFNEREIPFELKMRNSLGSYYRPDSAILFIHRLHFFIATDIIVRIYKILEDVLGLYPEVPKFTKELAKGLGFGENPPNTYDSFGMYRAKAISGILKGEDIHRVSSYKIIKSLKKLGFNIYELYRNPFVEENEFKFNYAQFTKKLNEFKLKISLSINRKIDLLPKFRYFLAARKIGYLICNEAIFYGDKCTWMVYKTKDKRNIFCSANRKEKLGIALLLSGIYKIHPFDEVFRELSLMILNESTRNPIPPNDEYIRIYEEYSKEVELEESDTRTINLETIIQSVDATYLLFQKEYYTNSMLADRIIARFLDLEIPFPNRYATDWSDANAGEFNPTLENGYAALGYFFLQLADVNEDLDALKSESNIKPVGSYILNKPRENNR